MVVIFSLILKGKYKLSAITLLYTNDKLKQSNKTYIYCKHLLYSPIRIKELIKELIPFMYL